MLSSSARSCAVRSRDCFGRPIAMVAIQELVKITLGTNRVSFFWDTTLVCSKPREERRGPGVPAFNLLAVRGRWPQAGEAHHRILAKVNSRVKADRPPTSFMPVASVGCTKTTAARRSSSANTGRKPGSSAYRPSLLVSMQTPSARHCEYAKSISRSVASTSGSGSVANMPKRPVYFAAMPAANSLHQRASAARALRSSRSNPGDVIEVMAAPMPGASMRRRASSTLHSGIRPEEPCAPIFKAPTSRT